MPRYSALCVSAVFVTLACGAGRANPANSISAQGLSKAIPDAIGVMVHDTSDANLDRAANAGFKIIRLDLTWYAVEQTKGTYDWSEYDAIAGRLKARGLRPLFILNFNNPNYGAVAEMDGIDTPEERNGFTAFAVAAVKRYQDTLNPLWEIYNEPNRPTFWTDPSAQEYVNLVKVVVPAMRTASPNLFIMGPGLGHAPALDGTDTQIKVDFGYLESTFAYGLLDYVDAVSIHPYPDGEPELAIGVYEDVRWLMNMYGQRRPIVSSEWGYSSEAQGSNTPQGHANFLTRMYLVNLSQEVVSVGYKLEAGSPDPTADLYERGFSWFQDDGSAKPVYAQVQAMSTALSGLSFVKRLPSDEGDYVLEFSNGTKTVVAAWTTRLPHSVTVDGRPVRITDQPIYTTTSSVRSNRNSTPHAEMR